LPHIPDLISLHNPQEMRRWSIHPDTGTMTEMWGRGDYSHGWVSAPLIQMSSRILGVTPAAPGFRAIAIRPLPSGLQWARGNVPTPRGTIHVAWELSGNTFNLEVSVPRGTTAEAFLPGGGGVVLDGVPITPGARGQISVPSGTHKLSRERS
jgi:alpha-L-rhamnosidase